MGISILSGVTVCHDLLPWEVDGGCGSRWDQRSQETQQHIELALFLGLHLICKTHLAEHPV